MLLFPLPSPTSLHLSLPPLFPLSSAMCELQQIYCADTNSHQHQPGKHGLAGPLGDVQHICRIDGSGCVSLPVPPALVIYILPERIHP